MSELYRSSLDAIKAPDGYVHFLLEFEKHIKEGALAKFGGQVTNRFGVPVCLIYGDPSTTPAMEIKLDELLKFCIQEGHGIEILDSQGRAISVPYGLLVSLSLNGTLFHRPCQIGDKETVLPEDYSLLPLSDEDVTPAARFFMNQLLVSIIKDRKPVALYFEGRDPSPFQALVFNVYQEDLPSEKHVSHVESVIRWFLPPSYLVRIYKRNDDLITELESAQPLVQDKP